jgi:hypothetical protein
LPIVDLLCYLCQKKGTGAMVKIFYSTVAILLVANLLLAQSGPQINFDHEMFDFGVIKEENGAVTHRFSFTNTGNAPLVINKVQTSCGCTTPDWSKEPLPPGEKGFIVARFDPRNRPGQFRKTLRIQSNAPKNVVLQISGVVQPRPKTVADEFPNKTGNLRSRYRTMHMGRVTTEKEVLKSFELYNDGSAPIIISGYNAPEYIVLKFEPDTIAPGSKSDMQVIYDTKARGDFGFVADLIQLNTNDTKDSQKKYRIVAVINEYFPPMTPEELDEAPRLSFSTKQLDLGAMNEGTVKKAAITITNTGKRQLDIRRVKTSCGCVVTEMEKDNLKPGESMDITVSFDATGRRGNQIKSITFFSNDPANPTQKVSLLARVIAL